MFLFENLTCSTSMQTVTNAIKFVLNIIRWLIPLVLIVLGTIDMFKAMASGDEKKSKEAQSHFIKRLIYAVVAFLIPFIVKLTLDVASQVISDQGDLTAAAQQKDFWSCWNWNNNSEGQTETKNSETEAQSNSTACNCTIAGTNYGQTTQEACATLAASDGYNADNWSCN